MLSGEITRYGGGITIVGDLADFRNLHEAIHKLASDHHNITPKIDEYVLGLAYDIRHAYQGDRLKIKMEGGVLNESITNIYPGITLLLPIVLVQTALLRKKSAYIPTSRLIQANLYALEAAIEIALSKVDANIANFTMEWLERSGSSFTETFNLNFIYDATYDYIHNFRGKKRISTLPHLLQSFHWFSEDYRSYTADIAREAEERGVPVENLTVTNREWDESIKW